MTNPIVTTTPDSRVTEPGRRTRPGDGLRTFSGNPYRHLQSPAAPTHCTMGAVNIEASAEGPTADQQETQRDEIAGIASRSLALRQWERQHLPTEASQVGFELFMSLAQWSARGLTDRSSLLKQLYLALPYSEKGVRLHLRRLEATGWITVYRTREDSRAARVELSDKYWRVLADYAQEWQRHVIVGEYYLLPTAPD